MYERFTDRAREVFMAANREAQQLKQEYIDTEHVLLGLISAGHGVGTTALTALGVDLGEIPPHVARRVKPGSYMVGDKLPVTRQTKEVVRHAMDEARAFCDQHGRNYYVGSEHLLLGLMHVDEGIAAQVLKELGMSLEGLHEEIV